MKRTALCVLFLLSLILMLSCGKDSKSPTAPLEDTYTISGTVTGADSVTVTLSGDASASWIVKKSGESYSFTVATGGTYTVTPSKSGYAFTPSDKTIKNLAANLTQNFEAKTASYTLSGTVTGADSVLVTLSGSSSATWMVIKSGGTYSFTVAAFGSYTITPTKKGYVFTPPNTKVENLVVNHVQSFDAIPLFTLSGTVTGADGVIVTLSGDTTGQQTVNNGGAYSFTVPKGGTYTISPSKQLYSFTPAKKTYENLSTNQIQDFDAKHDTYTISGTVTSADGVTVTLSGDASGTQTVNSGESYSFTVNAGGTYTVTPSKSGYAFTPSDKTIKNLSANLTQNFDAKLASYKLSGTVTGADSVTVTLSGGSSATFMVNKSGGTYSFTVATFGTYTITPTKKGYGFTPPNMKVENLVANHVQSFEAIPLSSFSPISNSIVCHSTNRDEGSIFIMNIDGTNERPIKNIGRNIGWCPSWSPDGRFIVFSYGGDGEDICITDINGSILINLTNSPNSREILPAWSPDGSKIAFSSNKSNKDIWEIYIINSDGTNQIRLTNLVGISNEPAWSPDGSKIAFSSNTSNIFIINIDGINLKQLTNSIYNSCPAWSPDGSKIAYGSQQSNNKFDIFIMNSDGTNKKNITNSPNSYDSYPSWTPDGSKIVFQSDRDGQRQLYIMNADGTEQRRITNNNYEYFSPKCSRY